MIPPNFVLDEMQRLHKWARLGWAGQERVGVEGELNKGSFILLQLYHKSDAEKTLELKLWKERGPVYGAPFDPIMRIPVMIGEMSKDDVFSGKAVDTLRYWLSPLKERLINSALAKGKEYDKQVTELAGEQGEYLFWKSNNSDAPTTMITKTDVTDEDKAVLRGERKRDLTKSFMPTYKPVY